MYLEDFIAANAEEMDDPHIFKMPDGTYSIYCCNEDGRTVVEFEPPATVQ